MKNKVIYDRINLGDVMNIVFKVSDNVKEELCKFYKDYMKPVAPQYTVFQAICEDTVVTLYESGKVMFQGMSADVDAKLWIDMEKHLNNRDIDISEKKEEKDRRYYYCSAIGSDEVGTGDYFFPIVVTATYVAKENIKYLESLKVDDSKKMTDEKILRCAPYIIKKIPYETLILSNADYNKYHSLGYNMNKIKAIMHNKVLFKLKSKGYDYDRIIVDQFALPNLYYGYIKEATEKVDDITFITKAESKNLSVAAASVLSRYVFLKEVERMCKDYNIDIPKGAGDKVDTVGKEIVKKYGKEFLDKNCKISFKNTEKILNKIES